MNLTEINWFLFLSSFLRCRRREIFASFTWFHIWGATHRYQGLDRILFFLNDFWECHTFCSANREIMFRCIRGCQKWIPDKILHRNDDPIFFSTFIFSSKKHILKMKKYFLGEISFFITEFGRFPFKIEWHF